MKFYIFVVCNKFETSNNEDAYTYSIRSFTFNYMLFHGVWQKERILRQIC